MDIIMYYFYYLSSHFEGFSPIVRITVLLTMLLGGLYILSLLRIGIVAYKTKRAKKRYLKVQEKYEQLLYNLLYTKEDKSADQILGNLGLENKKLKDWEKACITDLLVSMTKNDYGIQ